MKTRQIVCWLLCIASPALAQVSPWSSGTYAYDGSGNVKAIGADYYVYDQVGRLVRGSADKERTGADSYQAYTYDAFGNRLTTITTGTACVNGCGVNVQVNNNGVTNNRVTDHGASYDAAGNLKQFDTNYYTYDHAGMLVTRSSSPTSADEQYIYTADNERLAIYTGGGNWRFTIRDLDAKVVREVTAFQNGGTTTWTWHRDHIFRDGLLLATILPEGVQHYHLDHLGTPRLVTDGTGRKLGVHAYYPFGDELNLGLAEQLSPERLKFTGHERDVSNGASLDDMHARYYSASVGRFLSVDLLLGDSRAPQTWNRYAYAGNNPINHTDPTGQCEQKPGEPICSDGQTTVTAKNPSDEEHYLFLMHETVETDLPFMGDWTLAHYHPSSLWNSYLTKQQEKAAGHPVIPGSGVVLIGMALVSGGGLDTLNPETDPWVREPASLQDQMALDAAERGAGVKIIDRLGDPRFLGMEKWEYRIKSSQGRDSVVHYVRDPRTGKLMDFKFTKRSGDTLARHER